MSISLPYGHGRIALDAPGAAVLAARVMPDPGAPTGTDAVRAALAEPIGSPTLAELARGKRDCTVIISDHTRPVPSRELLPPMLAELRRGQPDIEITLLVATGLHRATRPEELEAKLGAEIFRNERIVVHDCDSADAELLGCLPSGAPLVIDRLAARCSLLVAEGFIEPHFFAGFSGGRKSVLPGVCARQTVLGNHCSAFIADPHARTGILEGNPIHRDMAAAARMANLAFIANSVIDPAHRTIAAFAGAPEPTHEAGCRWLRERCAVRAVPADIVVTSNGGAPLDQNVYQAVKCMTAAEASAKPGAVIIACAECADGVGGEAFYRDFAGMSSPAALLDAIAAVPAEQTRPDQWQSQVLARVMAAHEVVLVTRPELRDTVVSMGMTYMPDIAAAMEYARGKRGADASLTVIPDGVSVIVEPERG